jgi:undecaprenyl pyrophosphate phosphatase UppP
MLSWILIAFIIAVIFGVVKIDDCKPYIKQSTAMAKKIFAIAHEWINTHVADLKKKSATKQNTNSADKK